MKRLCTICARSGSKGVSGKNLKEIAGHPLIAHTIKQAIDSKLFDTIAVSSDGKEILEVSKSYGADFVIERPEELATDTSGKLGAIQHCVNEVEKTASKSFDTFVDLDCTSPLRDVQDIIEAVQMLEQGDCSNVITGTPSRRSPYFNMVEETGNGFVKLSKQVESNVLRRQDAPASYDMNASIYVWSRDSFFTLDHVLSEQTKIYIMPEERSHDIDSPLDFEIVKFLMEKKYED